MANVAMNPKQYLALIASSFSILAGVTVLSAAASAETFVISNTIGNTDKALNTNSRFTLIDGHPRMSIFGHNINDADQHFDRSQGSRGGQLLRHRSTGKCLNAYRRWNGAEVNVYRCDANDPDQNFNVENLSNGDVQIRLSEIRNNVRFCIDSPTRGDGGKVTLWQCNSGVNQRFRINGGIIIAPSSFDNFVRNFVNTWSIARLDPTPGWDSRGQCVTFVARYIQEVYLTGTEKTKSYAFGHGKDTARVVSSTFSRFFLPVTSEGLPKRGAIVSFPQIGVVKGITYGHTAIVMESRTSNGQRQIRIMDSNSDNRAPNSQVKEHAHWINIPNGSANGYGNGIYWTNPR